MHFGNRTPKEEAFAILDRAFDLGINFLDTANVYNDGRSEEIIGEWLAQCPARRDKLIIATKFYGHLEPGEPNEEVGVSLYKCRRSLEGSLRRMRTDHIDIYQSHHIDKRITPEEYWEMMHMNIMNGQNPVCGRLQFHRVVFGRAADGRPASWILRPCVGAIQLQPAGIALSSWKLFQPPSGTASAFLPS